MRNLKRALSLAMASVMLLGMMVVGTSAAGYSDVSAEQNQEAIEVLQAAGIMTGDQNGNFNPAANVTRNEMAVVMSNLMDYTVSTYKGTSPFTDVPDWAEPYVAACYTNGIIAGYSDTTFGGNDPVTTGQAALMLLKALGYFQEPGDFGEDWLVATTKQGALAELFDGVDTGATDPLTRNDVAQLVLNALQADCVRVGSHDLVSDGKGGFTTKAVYSERTSTAVKYDKIVLDNVIQLGEELYGGDLERKGAVDAFGRPAVEWKYDAQKIGLYTDDSDLIATYTAKAPKGELYSAIGSSVFNNIVAANPEDDEYTLSVVVDGISVANPNKNNYFDKNSTAAAGVRGNFGTGVSGNGIVTELYLDSTNNEVLIVMVSTWLVKATADYNETRELVTVEPVVINSDAAGNNTDVAAPALPTSIEQDDFNVSDVKEGDYLLVTYSRGSDSLESVQKAELLTGSVSEYTETENVYINGTKYSYNKVLGTNEKSEQYTINEDATVVLDAYGYIIYVDEAISTSSFVYIQDVDGATALKKKAVGAAYFTDGIFDEINIAKYVEADGTSHTSGEYLSNPGNIHGWYTFMKDSADNYTLYEVRDPRDVNSDWNNANNSGNDVNMVSNSIVKFLTNPANNVRGNADTIFIVLDNDDELTAYTGVENVPNIIIKDDCDADKVESTGWRRTAMPSTSSSTLPVLWIPRLSSMT